MTQVAGNRGMFLSMNARRRSKFVLRALTADSDVGHTVMKTRERASGAAEPAASSQPGGQRVRSLRFLPCGWEPEANTHSPEEMCAAEKKSQRHRTRSCGSL